MKGIVMQCSPFLNCGVFSDLWHKGKEWSTMFEAFTLEMKAEHKFLLENMQLLHEFHNS